MKIFSPIAQFSSAKAVWARRFSKLTFYHAGYIPIPGAGQAICALSRTWDEPAVDCRAVNLSLDFSRARLEYVGRARQFSEGQQSRTGV
jgi:hypothetical protein